MPGVGGGASSPQKVGISTANPSHRRNSEEQGQTSHVAGIRDNHALTDVKTIIAFKAELKSGLHHQPKVADHRGTMQRARNRATVTKILGGNVMDDHEKRNPQLERARRSTLGNTGVPQGRKGSTKLRNRLSVKKLSKFGNDSSSSGSDESGKSENEKTPGEDQASWDAFVNEGPEEGELLEMGPLYEMANVDIVVEEELAEMKETLRVFEKQGRFSDRERTVIMDKFSLFLQALVSFQENEVELIDHIGMKMQIMEVFGGFSKDDTDTTDLLLAEQTTIDEDKEGGLGELSSTKIPTLPEEAGEIDEPDEHHAVADIDEMNAATMRENLLTQKNRLEMQEQMKVIHLLEIKHLEFEKTLLTLHYAKMIKPADVQKEMQELRKTITDMKIEIGTMQQEIAQIQLDIAAEEEILREEESDTNRLDLDTLSKQIEVTQNGARPIHMAKDADREAYKLEQLQDKLEELEGRWMSEMTKFRAYQRRIDHKNSEYATLLKEEARMTAGAKQIQADTERVLVDIEFLEKKEQMLINKARVTVEKTGYNLKLKKKLYEQHHGILNESMRAQRDCLKLERTIRTARETFLVAHLAHEKMRAAFDTMQHIGDSENWERLRKMFTFEIDHLKAALDQRAADSIVQTTNLEALQEKLNDLYEEQLHYGKDLQALTRATVRKRRERQDKAEQCIKLESQLYGIETDIRMKKLRLDDCTRHERELHRSLVLIHKQYSQVKVEKAAAATELIQAKQRVTEQNAKFKIANNEVESYVNQSQDRQKEITRIHYLLLNAGLARDSIRNDALRAVQKFRFHRIERDELKMENENSRKEIYRLRKDMSAVRARFDTAIDDSSKVALRLRERTEEVCDFIERIQAYEMILLKGTVELRLRELEKAKLTATLHEVKTHLMIVTSKEPNEIKYVSQVEELRQKFSDITRERRALEAEVSDTTKAGRVRELHHDWIEEREKPAQLKSKIDNMESLLATRELRILERSLTLKQVNEVTEGNMVKATQLKVKYDCEVKFLVGMRKTLTTLSNRIDGMICETSLSLARADSVESEYIIQKRALLAAEDRFERGFPPSRSIQYQWNRKCWQAEMLRRSKVAACERAVGVPRKIPRPTGAGVVMERLRPKPKAPPRSVFEPPPKPDCDFATVGRCCPKFPYKPQYRNMKLSCIKPPVSRLPTGLRRCEPSPKPLAPQRRPSMN